jgi:indole-3-glycerol phosphate synthase
MAALLEEIIKVKQKEIEAQKARMGVADFIDSPGLLKGVRDFKGAISAPGRINLIAEIKRKSPSWKRGFFKRFDVARLAGIYESCGARALSVLTDRRFFGGDVSHIKIAGSASKLPVLRKDFIIDEYQIYESRFYGADAVLLIARILKEEEIRSFMHLAEKIGMGYIVEVHDEEDAKKAVDSGAKIIGINNRDLNTLKTDIETTFKLLPLLPGDAVIVSESGIKSHEDVMRLKKAGINAVLIGEAFLKSGDIEKGVAEITGERNDAKDKD